MRLDPCRRSDRLHVPWIHRLFLSLAIISLSGCADEESTRQEQLRTPYGSGPRSALPLGTIETASREGRADPECTAILAAVLVQQAEYARAVVLYQAALGKAPR